MMGIKKAYTIEEVPYVVFNGDNAGEVERIFRRWNESYSFTVDKGSVVASLFRNKREQAVVTGDYVVLDDGVRVLKKAEFDKEYTSHPYRQGESRDGEGRIDGFTTEYVCNICGERMSREEAEYHSHPYVTITCSIANGAPNVSIKASLDFDHSTMTPMSPKICVFGSSIETSIFCRIEDKAEAVRILKEYSRKYIDSLADKISDEFDKTESSL